MQPIAFYLATFYYAEPIQRRPTRRTTRNRPTRITRLGERSTVSAEFDQGISPLDREHKSEVVLTTAVTRCP